MSYKIEDQESGQQYEGHRVEGEEFASFPKLAQFFHIDFMHPGEQVFATVGGYTRSFIVL